MCIRDRNSSRSIGQSLESPCERDELRFNVEAMLRTRITILARAIKGNDRQLE